jgi:hypothetical protein
MLSTTSVGKQLLNYGCADASLHTHTLPGTNEYADGREHEAANGSEDAVFWQRMCACDDAMVGATGS